MRRALFVPTLCFPQAYAMGLMPAAPLRGLFILSPDKLTLSLAGRARKAGGPQGAVALFEPGTALESGGLPPGGPQDP